jgi:hypothetical protein
MRYSLSAEMRHRPGVGIVTAVVAVAAETVGTFVSPAKAPAAGDRQSSTIERRVSCETELGALQIGVFARNPAAGAAAANIHTGDPSGSVPNILLAVDTRYKHYVLGSSCHRLAKRIPLTHRGLTSAGVVKAGEYRSPTIYCAATAHVLIHFRLGFDAEGKPVSARIAVRTQPKPRNGKKRKSKAIGYAQWSPQRSVTYYSSRACTSQG